MDAGAVGDRVRVGIADDDGHLPLPGAFAAYVRGLVIVFGQLRKLVAVVVLLAMLLIPVLPVVSVRTGTFLSTFVVLALLPVTYLRREGATTRVSLVWLAGVLFASVGLNIPWIGLGLWWFLVPLVAIPAAAWSSGSWRIAAMSIIELFVRTWLGTIAALTIATWTFGILVAIPLIATWEFDDTPDAAWSAVGVGYLFLITAFGIGYAQVALERRATVAARTELTDVPTDVPT